MGWLKPLQYVCALKYGINILAVSELGAFSRANLNSYFLADQGPLVVSQLVKQVEVFKEGAQVKDNMLGAYVTILLGGAVVFRLLGIFVLHRKAKFLA